VAAQTLATWYSASALSAAAKGLEGAVAVTA